MSSSCHASARGASLLLAVMAAMAAMAVSPAPIPAQDPPAARPAAGAARIPPLRVFVDCQFYCDFDFLRTEIPVVDYVRDRADADLHVLVTRIATGGGGGEYTLNAIGLRRLAGVNDTLRYLEPANSSDDDRRRGIAKTIKLALARHLAGTPAADALQITFSAPAANAAPAAPTSDPWNYWVYRVGLNGFFNGEESTSQMNLSGTLSARRITERWKLTFAASGSNARSRFELGEGVTERSHTERYGGSALGVRSVGPHGSAGAQLSARRSTFENYDLRVRGGPAVEYNVFPYAEATRRQLTARYTLGAARNDYREETVFEQTSETLPYHSLIVSYDVRQQWGSVHGAVENTAFLNDFSKRRLSVFGELDLRLTRGLQLNFFGEWAQIRDQLNIPRRSASDEDILLRRRQLLSGYNYFGSVGLSYTFGSIFNNVVNPRFGSGFDQ